MAVRYERIHFPLVGGLDTKSAAATVGPDKLQVLENGVFTKRGSVKKRPGYSEVDQITATGAIAGTPCGLFARGSQLGMATTRRLYGYDNIGNKWSEQGLYNPTTHTETPVLYSNEDQTQADVAVAGTLIAGVWVRASGELRFAVADLFNGNIYAPDNQLAAVGVGSRPHVLRLGNMLAITYADIATSAVVIKLIQPGNLAASIAAAPVLLTSTVNASLRYAVTEAVRGAQHSGFIVWHTDGTGPAGAGVAVASLSESGVISLETNVTATVPAALAVAHNSVNDQVGVVWNATPDRVVRTFAGSTLVATGAEVALATDANVVRCAVSANEDPALVGSQPFVYWFEGSAAAASNHYVESVAPSVAAVRIRHAFIASQGFVNQTRGCILLGHESRTGLQNSYYLYSGTGSCFGAVLAGTGDTRPSTDKYSRLTGHLTALMPFRHQLDVDPNSSQAAHRGLALVRLNPTAPVSHAQMGHATYLSGSQLWMFDTGGTVEAGFHMFPDMLPGSTVLAASAGDMGIVNGGNLLDDVQYNYRVYYEWYTTRGERMRSSAVTRSFRPDFAGANGRVTIQIPTLRHTLKSASASFPKATEVSIVVYRTEANSSQLFYRVSSASSADTGLADNMYLQNIWTADTVSFRDNMTDADLIGKEMDYASALELFNVAPPAPAMLVAAQDRVYIAGGAVAPGLVLASKQHFTGDTVQFASELEIQVNSQELTGLTAIDEAPIVFSRDRVFAIVGDTDNTGGGQGFDANQLTADVGCLDNRSITVAGDMLMFQTGKGIYSMSQDLTIAYVGAEVEAYNAQTIVAAHPMPDTTQAVFLTSSGVTLMYDYFYRQWGTFTGHLGQAAVTYGGALGQDYAYMRNDGIVYVRDPDAYTDAGSPYVLKVRTGNVQLDTLQGFWRVRRVGVLGEYKSPHQLRVGIYHGRDLAPFEVFTWTPALVLDTSTWGEWATWGDFTVWGGDFGSTDYQFLHRTRRQKSQQIRLEFEDILSADVGPAYELTEIVLEVGIMDGIARVGTGRKI